MIKYLFLFFVPISICADDLFNAVLANNVPYVSHLIKNNIDINVTNHVGINALHLVKDRNMAELLLLQGIDPNAENNIGSTPLQWAVSDENFQTVLFFLEYGADINHQDQNGNTALHHAVTSSPEMIILLLRGGADINIKNNMGYTPLQTALQKGCTVNATYLSSTTIKAVIAENKLIKPNMSIKANNTEKQILQANIPPEILAIFSEDYSTAKTLITKTSDVNSIKDEQGNTMLHWVVIKKNRPLIKLLLMKKADAMIANNEGLTISNLLENIGDINLTTYINSLLEEQKILPDYNRK